MNPGDFDSIFIKAGASETKEGLRVEEATEESLRGALLWLPRNFIGEKSAKVCPLMAHGEVRKGGLGDKIRG